MSEKYTVSDVMAAMQEIAPVETAESWDHVGLMIGDLGSEVNGVLLALDANAAAIEMAKSVKANMIITHHPLFFDPVHEIDYATSKGANIRELIKNDITLFAAHTNLDKAHTGVNQALFDALGLIMPVLLEGTEVGVCGSVGQESMTFLSYAKHVKEALGASGVILNTDKDKEVSRIFVQGGAFDEETIPILKLYRVDCVVTGEMKHHHMLELDDAGIGVIAAGHEVTERIVLPSLQEQLLHKLPNLAISVYKGLNW